MAGLLMPLLLLVGGYIFFAKLGGKEMIDDLLGGNKTSFYTYNRIGNV